MWFQVAEEVLRLTEETRKNFFTGDRAYLEGEEMRSPELADTLEEIGKEGVDLFYEGRLARQLSSYILKMGGIITERDLSEYEAIIRAPLEVGYGAGTVYTNGPPSAGGATLAQDRKSTRLNSSHANISYAVFCLKKKKDTNCSLTKSSSGLPMEGNREHPYHTPQMFTPRTSQPVKFWIFLNCSTNASAMRSATVY